MDEKLIKDYHQAPTLMKAVNNSDQAVSAADYYIYYYFKITEKIYCMNLTLLKMCCLVLNLLN